MAPDSVSFRITRTAEDLAQTVAALSHRLVHLEQRLSVLELALDERQRPEPRELEALANVEVLLRDCREMLEESAPSATQTANLEAVSIGQEEADGSVLAELDQAA
jgi:DNA-binding transcriptional LysR family regulator